MKGFLVVLGVILGIVLIAGGAFVSTRNTLVTLNESVNSAWAQVENVYQRRADLIPNLVSTVKGYAGHERETLQAVVEARSRVGQMSADGLKNAINSPEALQKFESAQDGLSSALSRLMVVVERYPELKANQNFLELQAQLEGTENRISVERGRFNEAVQAYNTAIIRFPASFVAAMSGLEKKAYFQSKPGSDVAPQVNF